MFRIEKAAIALAQLIRINHEFVFRFEIKRFQRAQISQQDKSIGIKKLKNHNKLSLLYHRDLFCRKMKIFVDA